MQNRQDPQNSAHLKRSRSPDPHSRHRPGKAPRRHQYPNGPSINVKEQTPRDGLTERKEQESFAREQTRLNQIQEAEQMREWVSKEDEFVLKQSKKKAHIRVREGRAKYIDWLAVTLGVIDPTMDPLEDEKSDAEVDIVDPAGGFEGLSRAQLQELEKDIGTYITLELNGSNRRYWNVRLTSSIAAITLTELRPLA